jgi:single-stranded-DNA-specific exonuclease
VTPELLTPAIEVDAALDLAAIGALRDRFWSVLKQFGPFGPSNPTPVFHAEAVAVVSARTVGQGGGHLKLKVRDASAPGMPPLDVIGFGLGEKLSVAQESLRAGTPMELLFSVEENTWQGRTTLQLRARDLRMDETG